MSASDIINAVFWVSLICFGLDVVIFGGMSGIAAATGEKYWEDFFFTLGVDLGTFFLSIIVFIGVLALIAKIFIRKEA